MKDIIMLAYFKDIVDRLDVLEARVNTLEAKLNNKHTELTAEQREILLADGITVKEKAKKLGRSTGWVSKWVNRSR